MDPNPNIDGDDYEMDGKYAFYRWLLRGVRRHPDVREDIKARRLQTLKTDLIPFWHRCRELDDSESKELMAIFLKYNGPDGIRKHYSQELEEMKARITDADDGILFKYMAEIDPAPASIQGKRTFNYAALGSIRYDMKHDTEEDNPQKEVPNRPKPVINLVPFGGTLDGVPHHHNMNPDDDPSLNATLLDVLQRLMTDKNGQPFINEVEQKNQEHYLRFVERPRYLKFIENGLRSDNSVGYGATAFFNDMLLLFFNCRSYHGPHSQYTTCGENLEKLMKKLLREKGRVGDQLLTQYDAIYQQRLESWPDPELIYFMPGYNPSLPGYKGEPEVGEVRIAAREQFRRGQERVQELRSRLSRGTSSSGQPPEKPPVEADAQIDSESRKRPREEEKDATDTNPDRPPKRRRSDRSPTPGPSNSSPVPPRRAGSMRLRATADDDTDDEDAKRDQGQGLSASKQQRLDNETAPSGASPSSFGAAGPPSQPDNPPRASPKRARTPTDDDSEGDDVEAGNGRGPSGSKRRRLTKDAPSSRIRNASPQAGPATPRRATPGPGDMEPGSVQSHVTSLAGQPTPQPVRFPTHYRTPSSTFLKFSRNSIPMSKIAKMGKKRPWLFSYETPEGYGIYAFVKCPRGNCKHHFSRHPLRENRAQDHILSCGQQIRDTRDMVRQYARQVIKDDDRKSDLTIDWARKSNLHLLPADQRDNHPENFPLSPEDD